MKKFIIGFLVFGSFFLNGISYAQESNDKGWEVKNG